MDFSTLAGDALTTALALDFDSLDEAALTAALAERRTSATSLFALTEPTIEQVNTAEAIVASIGTIEAEQAERTALATEAAARFAAARASFSTDEEVEAAAEEEVEASAEGDEAETEEVDETEVEPAEAEPAEADDAGDTVTASVRNGTKVKPVSAAKKVGARTQRPAVKASQDVVITAGADIPNIATGSRLPDMDAVGKALIARAKGFPKFSQSAGKAMNSQTGGATAVSKFGVASFGIDSGTLTEQSTPGEEFAAGKAAIKAHTDALVASMAAGQTLTAAGWCAPSTTVYSYTSDYVIDGLLTLPEVPAPRGGLMITTGPAREVTLDNLDDLGWIQTEAQAEAGQVKPFETIICPPFVDHRLDAIGYGYKIPLLTQKAYPELVTETLKYAAMLYAHKVNRRLINDIVALSDAVSFEGYGPSTTDTLEALSIIAVKERRRYSIGVNAPMEVKLPQWTLEVFRADMSRRSGLALDDVATDQKLAAHFAARHLAVEWLADYEPLLDENVVLPGSFPAIIYPAGTFVKAIEDVVNLSAIYDAASLSVNEYTGIFFEQGIMTVKVAYGARKIRININTAGESGANDLFGRGDHSEGGSF